MSSEDEQEVVEETTIRVRKKRRTSGSLSGSSEPELRVFQRFENESDIFRDIRKKCFEYCYMQIEKAARNILIESAPIDIHTETINFINTFINDWRTMRRQ